MEIYIGQEYCNDIIDDWMREFTHEEMSDYTSFKSFNLLNKEPLPDDILTVNFPLYMYMLHVSGVMDDTKLTSENEYHSLFDGMYILSLYDKTKCIGGYCMIYLLDNPKKAALKENVSSYGIYYSTYSLINTNKVKCLTYSYPNMYSSVQDSYYHVCCNYTWLDDELKPIVLSKFSKLIKLYNDNLIKLRRNDGIHQMKDIDEMCMIRNKILDIYT